MVKKRFKLGMVVMTLTFGMMVAGCDDGSTDKGNDYNYDYDNRPSLSGTVTFDKQVYYPVVGEIFTATFEKYSFSNDPIGKASWKWYKTKENSYSLSDITYKTQISTGDSYTLTTADVDYWIWAEVSYSGNKDANASRISIISAVLSDPHLSGNVSLDNYYPAVGETITASYKKSYSGDDPIGTVSWRWYKSENKTGEKSFISSSGDTYTVYQSDVGCWIQAEVSYSGNSGSASGWTYSSVIGISATATVSVSVEALRILGSSIDTALFGNHRVTVTLALSDGKWNDVSSYTASQWLTITGSPSIDSWPSSLFYFNPSVSAKGRELVLSYLAFSETTLSINLTVALDTSKLSTMRSNTNVYNALTSGEPSSVSVSQWTISNY